MLNRQRQLPKCVTTHVEKGDRAGIDIATIDDKILVIVPHQHGQSPMRDVPANVASNLEQA